MGVNPPRGGTVPQKGIVAVSQPLSAGAGAEILAGGGNAIDAIAAIQLAMTVEEPSSNGIGGGGFMVIHAAGTGETVMVCTREKAPAGGTPDLFLDENGQPLPFEEAVASGRSVGVPGTLMGLDTILRKYGTMTLAEVARPALRMADEGITITDFMAARIAQAEAKISREPGRAYPFFRPDGTLRRPGDLLVQKELARTLRLIADQGIDAFYRGPIARAIAEVVKARGGPLEPSDLAAYTLLERAPIRGSYRGWEIASSAPPSSGGLILVSALKMLERFDLRGMGHNSADTLHLFLEAMRLAFADRFKYLGDPAFVKVPEKGLLNPDYLAARGANLQMDRASAEVAAGDPWQYEGAASPSTAPGGPNREGGETTHFVAADRWGNVVSCTTTVEQVFGSGIMVPGYGFMLNNNMTQFDPVPGGLNQYEPGKRGLSSQTPTILFKDRKPVLATGSPGGSTIPFTTAQIIMNVVDHGMSVQEAVQAARVTFLWGNLATPQWAGATRPTVRWEEGIPGAVLEQLARRGHQVDAEPFPIGSAQTIAIDPVTGRMSGAGDPRRLGTVLSAL